MKFNCHLIIHRLSAILLATTIFANLSITSALATTSKNPFQDVSENAPYAEAVQYVYDRGISHGTGATTFFTQQPYYLWGVVDVVRAPPPPPAEAR